jgi:hypothetical protein
MAEKPGPKGRISSADYVHIRRLINEGRTDESISCIFGVHRSTITRLRHKLESGTDPADPENAFRAFQRIATMPPGPERDAALERSQRERLGDAEYDRRQQQRAEYEAYSREHHCGMCETDERIRELHSQ